MTITTTLTYSCTANFGPETGCDQDLKKGEIEQAIQMDYDVENNLLLNNDQNVWAGDVAHIVWVVVEITCMEDRSSIEYTVSAKVEIEPNEDEDGWC